MGKHRLTLSVAAIFALFLAGCGGDATDAVGSGETLTVPTPTVEATAEPTTAEPEPDPLIACGGLFDDGAESVAYRGVELLETLPETLDRETAASYLVIDAELNAIAASAPTELAELISELRAPFAEVSVASTGGGEAPAPDLEAIETTVGELTAACEAAGYVMPEIPESPYGEAVSSSRGNLIKEIGQLAGITSRAGETLVDFAVTEVAVDIECTGGWVDAPANGHFVGFKFDITTYPELANETDLPEFWMSAHDFRAWTSDGTRVNDPVGNSFTCMKDSDGLPMPIGPDERVSGWIVLDLPEPSGAVGFSWVGVDGTGGWEWNYGQTE